ncbi:MAG: hypothetical protein H0U27_11445 [Nitrosopumilus sp.]|nr:hypothetical protein [Nitrosopumilus sp.]
MSYNKSTSNHPSWQHAGGKLRELGPQKLNDAELLSILIGTGTKGKTAEEIAKELLQKYNSYKGLAGLELRELLKIKGLGEVKIIRIAATFEIARRIVNKVLEEHEQTKK